jgi:ribosome biogenesis GTPase A
MTTVKEEIIPTDEVAFYILNMLEKYYKETLLSLYGVKEINEEDITATYQTIAAFRSIKTKEEFELYDRVSLAVINDIKSEKLKNITFDRIGD